VSPAAADDVGNAESGKENKHADEDEEDKKPIATQVLVVIRIRLAELAVTVASAIMRGTGPPIMYTAGSLGFVGA
jgi:hypothetical protein